MTTSGNTIYQLDRNDLVESALRKLSVLAEGQTPSAESYANAAVAVNTLIAQLRVVGMPVWARTSYSFSPTVNVASYNIGTGQTLNTHYPITLYQALRADTDGNKIPMDIVSDYDFNILPSNTTGMPIQVTYQPKNNLGVLKLWPTPDTSGATITITLHYQKPFEYFDSATDTLDMPEHWYLVIIYGLAVLLAPEWGIPLEDRKQLASEYKMYLATATDDLNENMSVRFYPEQRY